MKNNLRRRLKFCQEKRNRSFGSFIITYSFLQLQIITLPHTRNLLRVSNFPIVCELAYFFFFFFISFAGAVEKVYVARRNFDCKKLLSTRKFETRTRNILDCWERFDGEKLFLVAVKNILDSYRGSSVANKLFPSSWRCRRNYFHLRGGDDGKFASRVNYFHLRGADDG